MQAPPHGMARIEAHLDKAKGRACVQLLCSKGALVTVPLAKVHVQQQSFETKQIHYDNPVETNHHTTTHTHTHRLLAAVIRPTVQRPLTVQFKDPARRFMHMKATRCIHSFQLLSPEECIRLRADAVRVAKKSGYEDRGVGLPTNDVLINNLSQRSIKLIHTAVKERLLPIALRYFPHLYFVLLDMLHGEEQPRPGNCFIVKYSATNSGKRGLALHRDETLCTFNVTLDDDFTGGGTFFPTGQGGGRGGGGEYQSHNVRKAHKDLSGFILRPEIGMAILHDGKVLHGAADVESGERYKFARASPPFTQF